MMRYVGAFLAILVSVPSVGYAQTLLDSVLVAHGVTNDTKSIKLKFEGRYERAGATSVPFVLKTRGYAESRLEVQTPGRTALVAQSRGFRWSKAGQDAVRDHDGRVSLNLPFMDSPSTGLLPFLLDRQSDIETVKREDGILNGRAVIALRLRVRDSDSNRRQIRATYDRTLDLLIDPVTFRVTAAAVLPSLQNPGESENYEYGGYITVNGLLFPSTVKRSAKFHPASIALRPLSVLRIDRVTADQTITDADFRRP